MSNVKTRTEIPATKKPAVPFFARKVERAKLTVRAGIRAGLREDASK
jgi:hypothetical protein